MIVPRLGGCRHASAPHDQVAVPLLDNLPMLRALRWPFVTRWLPMLAITRETALVPPTRPSHLTMFTALITGNQHRAYMLRGCISGRTDRMGRRVDFSALLTLAASSTNG